MSTEFEWLSNEVEQAVQAICRSGLDAMAAIDAGHLWRNVHHMPGIATSPDKQALFFRTALVRQAAFAFYALEDFSNWKEVALVGADLNGALQYPVPWTPDARRLYALLLTNSVVARCIYGQELQSSIAYLASEAYGLFSQLGNARASHWVATLYVSLAHAEHNASHARRALEIMGPNPTVSEDLRVYAQVLAGERKSGVVVTKSGLFGLGRQTHEAFFSAQDLFLFNH